MSVQPERLRHNLVEHQHHRQRRLAAREPGAVADAEDVGVDREGLRAEGDVLTTFAVLRPTPGSFSSASRSAGTAPP